MKRLLFAGMIFLLSPSDVCTQTKAGKTDTMQHAVFYTHAAGAACTAAANFSAKEKQGSKRVRKETSHICIRTATGGRTNRSSKELMKMAVTGNQ